MESEIKKHAYIMTMTELPNSPGPQVKSILKHIVLWLAIIGPGLMVMLADTDAGSLITAAQSGSRWRYAMVLPLLVTAI